MHALQIISGLVKKDFVEWVQKIRENEYISALRDSWNFLRKSTSCIGHTSEYGPYPYLVSKSRPHNHTVPYPKSYPKISKPGRDMKWNLLFTYTFFSLWIMVRGSLRLLFLISTHFKVSLWLIFTGPTFKGPTYFSCQGPRYKRTNFFFSLRTNV